MITLRYKRKNEREWMYWVCNSIEEADKVRKQLKADGYIVEG